VVISGHGEAERPSCGRSGSAGWQEGRQSPMGRGLEEGAFGHSSESGTGTVGEGQNVTTLTFGLIASLVPADLSLRGLLRALVSLARSSRPFEARSLSRVLRAVADRTVSHSLVS